ncbi:SEL1-like repeat protein [Magnetospira sp. QH-2]|uniref:SEL1-like repeat protein n=1 Tax=Magnetospira sp. (strain QH-2) TaxID=1288970 RepID=UPI0003E80FEE|nr:SEL1-like repeat protein [Magnetospira sp. QH-2]CCQ72382.1 protein of unknown function [Magnetospira sp. QH-2]
MRCHAEAGVPRAMTLMGDFIGAGHGIEQDPPRAREWYRKAALADEPEGQQRYAADMFFAIGGRLDSNFKRMYGSPL